jgi:hypothetical protein
MVRLMKNAWLVKNAATHIKTCVINTMSKAKFDFSKHFEGRYKISTDLSACGLWFFEVKWKLVLLFYTRWHRRCSFLPLYPRCGPGNCTKKIKINKCPGGERVGEGGGGWGWGGEGEGGGMRGGRNWNWLMHVPGFFPINLHYFSCSIRTYYTLLIIVCKYIFTERYLTLKVPVLYSFLNLRLAFLLAFGAV